MARPVNPCAPYNVSLHVTKGYRYACTQPEGVSRKTGETYHRYVHWGRVDENNKFFPNKRYLSTALEDRRRLIFPKDWDLSEIDKLPISGNMAAGEGQGENLGCGDVWLLERTADAEGIRGDLLDALNGNSDKADLVMTFAAFLLCGQGDLEAWLKNTKTPYSLPLSEEAVKKVMGSLADHDRLNLVRLRAKRAGEGGFVVFDTDFTSSVTDSFNPGRRFTVGGCLPEPPGMRDVVCISADGGIPAYTGTFDSALSKDRCLEIVRDDLARAGLEKVVFVTDSGHRQIGCLDFLAGAGRSVVMETSVFQDFVQEKIREEVKAGTRYESNYSYERYYFHPHGMEWGGGPYTKQYALDWPSGWVSHTASKPGTLKLNLYFHSSLYQTERIEIENAIDSQKLALSRIQNQGLPFDDPETLARTFDFFRLEYDEGARTLTGFTLNKEKVDMMRRSAGFSAVISYGFDGSADDVLRRCRSRTEQEKYFAIIAGNLASKGFRSWLEPGSVGQAVVLLTAQALYFHLESSIHKSFERWEHSDNAMSWLAEMRSIRYVKHPGKQAGITPFTKDQIRMCERLGFAVPPGCAPSYQKSWSWH